MAMLSNKKNTSIVGLDIDAGSVAATEVHVNGFPRVERVAVAPIGADAVRDGEVADVKQLSSSLRDFFSEHKLPKEVRLGVANQRVVVRTLRLPLIEDSKQFAAAVHFRAQE